MSWRMYEPEKKSRFYLYVFMFTAAIVGWAMFAALRPLTIESSCSEIAEKSSGLTLNKSFQYDPYSSYDVVKANCLEEVLSSNSDR